MKDNSKLIEVAALFLSGFIVNSSTDESYRDKQILMALDYAKRLIEKAEQIK